MPQRLEWWTPCISVHLTENLDHVPLFDPCSNDYLILLWPKGNVDHVCDMQKMSWPWKGHQDSISMIVTVNRGQARVNNPQPLVAQSTDNDRWLVKMPLTNGSRLTKQSVDKDSLISPHGDRSWNWFWGAQLFVLSLCMFAALMTLGPMMKYQIFLKNPMRHPHHPTANPGFFRRSSKCNRLRCICKFSGKHAYCPTGGLQTSLLNRNLHFPLEHSTWCYWPGAWHIGQRWAWSAVQRWEDNWNQWMECAWNVGICADVRCLRCWISTLAMSFRGFRWSECMVGLELRLDFSSTRREGFRELWSNGRTR